MAISLLFANTATIGELFAKVNTVIGEVNVILSGSGFNASTLESHPASYFARSATVITAGGLATGGGAFSANSTITVTAATSSTAAGAFSDRALTPISLRTPTINVPSGMTTNIGAANSFYVNITGTSSIGFFDSSVTGVLRTGTFSNTISLLGDPTYLQVPGTNYTTSPGDRFAALCTGTNHWTILYIAKADGKPTVFPDWADIGTKPTTLAGFGITDGASLSVADQIITGGAVVSPLSLTLTGTVTLDPGLRPLQYGTNNGAFTLSVPSNDGTMLLLITNGAAAGTVTFSGFSVGVVTGDALDTTVGHKFIIGIYRVFGSTTYHIKALQ